MARLSSNALALVAMAVAFLATATAVDARRLQADAAFAVPKLNGALVDLAASWLSGSSSAHQHVQAALQQHLQQDVYWRHFEL
jgi:hypothetical protein